jgi:extracellular factor (EF) 3-hydroxypalmitic acid methyl ester biosynthesis protein
MVKEAFRGEARLLSGDRETTVNVQYASKFSLLVNRDDGITPSPDNNHYELTLNIDGKWMNLGTCTLLNDEMSSDEFYRLVLTRDVYDFDALITRNKLVTLQNGFLNIPSLLGHKKEIKKEFVEYTAELSYDLCVYKQMFDALDEEYSEESEEIRILLQNAILETEGRKFLNYLDRRLEELEELVKDFSRQEHKTHGFYFRKQLWSYILCSPFMARTNLKPLGYAGDYRMMQMIYSKALEGESTFGKLMHYHPMQHPGAQAVCSRRNLVARIIRDRLEKNTGPSEPVRILSVASGPAFELQDILRSPEDCPRCRFFLLDQDSRALAEAGTLVDTLATTHGTEIEASPIKASIRTLLSTRELRDKWGEFDVIYSMGLFDYLTPPVATALLNKLSQLLAPEGEMTIGNFHVSNTGKVYMEYWLDWVLYYRTEEEFLSLIQNDLLQGEVVFEDTGNQMFLKAQKV